MKQTFTLFILCLSFAQIRAQIISTITGNGTAAFSGDNGTATIAEVDSPSDVAIDKNGNIFIADRNNSRIRKINTSGIITTIAGNGSIGFSGDGGLALTATLGRPTGIALDSAGNIYINDQDNHRIRKISITGIITTIAGNGATGYTGDGGNAALATFNLGFGIASDKAGNIFIPDFGNHVIRKISTSGIITTVVGNGIAGNSGDGGFATNARLNYPNWVTVDRYNNIFISDFNNNKIRKVDTFGIITTIAGNATGSSGYAGDGGLATSALLNKPSGITVDTIGNVYVADNDRIRVINASSGIINTVAGNGTLGYSGDGGLATYANISGRSGIFMYKNDLYLAEAYTNRIRKVRGVILGIDQHALNNYMIDVYPNPTSGICTITSSRNENQTIYIFDMKGNLILKENFKQQIVIDLTNLADGIYTLSLKTSQLVVNKKIVVIR